MGEKKFQTDAEENEASSEERKEGRKVEKGGEGGQRREDKW